MSEVCAKYEKVRYMTYSDYEYLSNRIRDQNKKISLLLALLVEKKILGEKMANIIKFGEATEEEVSSDIVAWYEAKNKRFIQDAIKKKGALRKALGIKEGETIPKSLLAKIASAKVGTKINVNGKSITVTAKLKKRVNLAKTLGKMKKK